MRATEITPSMMSTQHQSEATNRTAMTAFPTRPASKNSPTGERSKPCMSIASFRSRFAFFAHHIVYFNPA